MILRRSCTNYYPFRLTFAYTQKRRAVIMKAVKWNWEKGIYVKIRDDADIVAFLQKIRFCRSRVEFFTVEGDRLDLKSTLAGYLLTALSADGEISKFGEVAFEDEGDKALLNDYLE